MVEMKCSAHHMIKRELFPTQPITLGKTKQPLVKEDVTNVLHTHTGVIPICYKNS